MAWQDNLRLQFLSVHQSCVKVGNFKPQEHTVSRCDVGIANATMMMFHFPAVQLKNQPPLRNEPLVIGAAVVTPTAQEPLIPATARFNITHANQGLGCHSNFAV